MWIRTGALLLASFLSIEAGAGLPAKTRFLASIKTDKRGVPLEDSRVGVDMVALDSQRQAITNLRHIISKQNRASPAYATLLTRLAEYQHQLADIVFRIEHANAFRVKRAINLKEYHRVLDESVKVLDEVIANFPDSREIQGAILLRAQAHEACGRYEDAARDFLVVVERFGNTKEEFIAYLTLAEIAGNAGRYDEVVRYLNKVKQRRDQENYPYVLYRLAWAYFQLQQIAPALQHAGMLVAEVERAGGTASAPSSLVSLRDELLEETPAFVLKWVEAGSREMSAPYALFRKLHGRAGRSHLETAMVRFAKLLRAHDRKDDLLAWKTISLREFPGSKATFDMLLLVGEDQLAKLQYKSFVTTVDDILAHSIKFPSTFDSARARQTLAGAAERLQSQVSKNPSMKATANLVLERVYDAMLATVAESDPVTYRIRYNLAELLSSRGDRPGAITNYFWLFRNRLALAKADGGKIDGLEAGLKALKLRYDELAVANLVPSGVSPTVLPAADPKTRPKALADWENTLATVAYAYADKLDNEKLDFFNFEECRVLYGAGYVREAVERMTDTVEDHPETRFAKQMASLVIDTYMKSEAWKQAEKTARVFVNLPSLQKDQKYLAGIASAGANAAYKVVETAFNKNEFQSVLLSERALNSRYSGSERADDWRNLIARAAVKAGDSKSALAQLSTLSASSKNQDYARDALAMKGQMLEDRLRYREAADSLTAYLARFGGKALKDEQKRELRERILFLSVISGDGDYFQGALASRELCIGETAAACDRFRALGTLLDREHSAAAKPDRGQNASVLALKELRDGKGDLWWALGRLEEVARHWPKLDPLARLLLLPGLRRAGEMVFSGRTALPGNEPLVPDEKSIAKRLDLVRHVEASVERILALPSLSLQAHAMGAVSRLYLAMAQELSEAKSPEGLAPEEVEAYRQVVTKAAQPFREAGRAIARRGLARASAGGLSGAPLNALLELLDREEQERWESRAPASENGTGLRDSAAAIVVLKVPEEGREAFARVHGRFAESVEAERWLEAAFLLRLMRQREWIDNSGMELLTAAMLEGMGAIPEALAAAERSRSGLRGGDRTRVNAALAGAFVKSRAREQVRSVINDVDKSGTAEARKEDLETIERARRWMKETSA